MDDPPDDDGAAAVGQRVVLLEDDLAADQVGRSDRARHAVRVDPRESGRAFQDIVVARLI